MANEEKIRNVVKVILADPKSWHQNTVVNMTECGTTYCIAGHTAMLEGWKVFTSFNRTKFWIAPEDNPGSEWDMQVDRAISFARETLEINEDQAEYLFYWMPSTTWNEETEESEDEEVFTPEMLVARVLDVTGVDCRDLLTNQQRRNAALAGVQYLREHPEQWSQFTYGRRIDNGEIRACWAGAVLLADGYSLDAIGGYTKKDGDKPQFGWDILEKVYGWDFEDAAGVIRVTGWTNAAHDAQGLDELEERVLAWLEYEESKTTKNKEN